MMNYITKFFTGVLIVFSIVGIISCGNVQPEPVKLNADNCQHCKMTIADLKFAAELITDKGRIYKFDDLKCMQMYQSENALNNAQFFVADYSKPENFVKVEDAFFVSGGDVLSPMNGNVAAFSSKADAEKFAVEKNAKQLSWKEVNP